MAKVFDRELRLIVVVSMVACGALLGAVVLLLYWTHLSWYFYDEPTLVPNSVHAIPETELIDVAIPNEWRLHSFNHISLRLPNEDEEVEGGPASVVFLEGDRSLLVEDSIDSKVIFSEVPNRTNTKSSVGLVQLRRDILSASSKDFQWSLSQDEVRWHIYCMRKRTGLLLRSVVESEYLNDGELEKLLLIQGDRAVLIWETSDRKHNGMITFVDLSGNEDRNWMRAASKSLIVNR
ncbi:MAG: hypothetical protein NXI22_04865 [bacterium]|nr:hypothetical protein [bacterium]